MSVSAMDKLHLPPVRDKKIGSWRFAAGRIRSLEVNLFRKSGLDRLFHAEELQDLRLLLQEHRYPQDDFAEALKKERIAVYDLLQEIAPQDAYRVALLVFADVHNLKFMLKENLKDSSKRSFDEMSHLLMKPSLADPAQVYELISGVGDKSAAQPWITELIDLGEKAYYDTYEVAAIDRALDKKAHMIAAELADDLGNDWFIRYFALQRDLINLETFFRVRHRALSETTYKESLLPEGLISEQEWQELYGAEDERISEVLNKVGYGVFEPYLETYGASGEAARFVRDRDQVLIDHIESGRHFLSGPELTLSYVLAREFEIKNLRIVDAAIRNRLHLEQRNALRRDLW